jgi:hypothetical protein
MSDEDEPGSAEQSDEIESLKPKKADRKKKRKPSGDSAKIVARTMLQEILADSSTSAERLQALEARLEEESQRARGRPKKGATVEILKPVRVQLQALMELYKTSGTLDRPPKTPVVKAHRVDTAPDTQGSAVGLPITAGDSLDASAAPAPPTPSTPKAARKKARAPAAGTSPAAGPGRGTAAAAAAAAFAAATVASSAATIGDTIAPAAAAPRAETGGVAAKTPRSLQARTRPVAAAYDEPDAFGVLERQAPAVRPARLVPIAVAQDVAAPTTVLPVPAAIAVEGGPDVPLRPLQATAPLRLGGDDGVLVSALCIGAEVGTLTMCGPGLLAVGTSPDGVRHHVTGQPCAHGGPPPAVQLWDVATRALRVQLVAAGPGCYGAASWLPLPELAGSHGVLALARDSLQSTLQLLCPPDISSLHGTRLPCSEV